MKLLIINNYDSFVYNLVQLVEQSGNSNYRIVKNNELLSLKKSDFDKALISPGPGVASEAGQLLTFIAKFFKIKPMLGVCLGHEAIAELFGAKLIKMQEPWHGIQGAGIVTKNDLLFEGLPSRFKIGHYHSWIMEKETLPKELEITMVDNEDRIMAIRHREFNLIGLQFHPESIMTEYGLKMMRNWLGA